MKENYIPFHVKDFKKIQLSLQDLYKDVLSNTDLKSFPKDWSQENFLDLYEIVNNFFNANNAQIVSTRFFYTPPGKSLGVHADGEWYEPMYWALNIPIFCAEDNHWQEWFDYHGDLNAIRSNSVHQHYILPNDPAKLELIDRLTLTTPHFLRVGTFHRINNQSSQGRLIASIRFETNAMRSLLSSVREQQIS